MTTHKLADESDEALIERLRRDVYDDNNAPRDLSLEAANRLEALAAIVPQRDAVIEECAVFLDGEAAAHRNAKVGEDDAIDAAVQLALAHRFKMVAEYIRALKSHPAPPAQDERGRIVKWLRDYGVNGTARPRSNSLVSEATMDAAASAIDPADHLPAKAEG